MNATDTLGDQAKHGMGIWWMILVISGLASLFLNIWHALHGKTDASTPEVAGKLVLALIIGVLPVVMAGLLSHSFVVAAPRPVRLGAVAVFAVGMAMSVTAQAEVMLPVAGDPLRAWGIPFIVDVPALLALYMIARAPGVAAETAALLEAEIEARVSAVRAAMQTDMDVRLEAARADIEARAEADMTARLDAARADIEALAEADMSGRLAVTKADIREELEADMSARLAAIRAEAEAAVSARVSAVRVEMEANIRREIETEMSARAKTEEVAAPARRKAISAPKQPAPEGLTSLDKARALLRDNPDMTGAEIGRALGMAERTGRRLRDEVLAEADMTAPEQADTEADTGADIEADIRTLHAV